MGNHAEENVEHVTDVSITNLNYTNMEINQEHMTQPVSSKQYQSVYPSEEIKDMIDHVTECEQISIQHLPTIIQAVYEAGYNQAMKDTEKTKEISKKIPDKSLDIQKE